MNISKIEKEDILYIINENQLDNLQDSTFFITGATGLVGGYFFKTIYLLNELFNKNHKIILLVRKPNAYIEYSNNDNVKIIVQDVIDNINIEDKVDYVIHAAGVASPKIMKIDPVGTNLANTLGTINTLNLAREKNAKCYLFISSREVYGEAPNDVKFFTEDGKLGYLDHTNVRNCYAESKKNAENLLVAYNYQYGMNVKAVRLAHTYGPGIRIDDGRVQSDFLKNYLSNENIIMKSTGASIRTYTYIADAINAMFKIIMLSPKNEIIYNVSDEINEISIRDLALTLVEIGKDNGKNIALKIDIPQKSNASYAPFSKGILSSKKVRDLGYKTKFTVKEGFVRTIKHLEEQNI